MKSLGDIIAEYRKKKCLSQTELSNHLGLLGYNATNKSISNWEKGIAEPSSSMLMALCKVLDITDIYKEYYGNNPDNPMSELNDTGREKALDYIALLVESGKYTLPKPMFHKSARIIRLFDLPASAGTGSFLDGESYTELEVGDEVPAAATFGIRLSGDSMEPQFISGQIVWVKQTETLLNGDIGIFYLNGNAYCKKLQDDIDGVHLTSLNKKYDPIPILKNDSFKIFGKVVS